MLEKGFRRAELPLGGLTLLRWDTQEDGAGTGCCSGLQTRTGEFSSHQRPGGSCCWLAAGRGAHCVGVGRKASKESNAGAANAVGGVAPAEDFHARLISAAKGRRRRRPSSESNFTGQKRQQ